MSMEKVDTMLKSTGMAYDEPGGGGNVVKSD
jgi:hypothetical protein